MPQQRKRRRSKRKKKLKTITPRKAGHRGYFPGLSRALGSVAGGYFAGPLGSELGAKAGDWFGKVTGLGDYKVNRNTLISDNGPPLFKNRGELRVRHREFVGAVTSSTTFSNTSYAINPGNSTLFPWLHGIARQYEQWKPHGILFEFKTTSGTAVGSTNTALGVVVMATNYNVREKIYRNRVEMEQAKFCTSTVACESMVHPIECKPSDQTLVSYYTRTSSDGLDSSDVRFNDLGRLNLATEGMQTGNIEIGELWVSYDIGFMKPRSPDTSGRFIHWHITGSTYDNLLGGTVVEQPGSNMSDLVDMDTGNDTIGMYVHGKYKASIYITSASATGFSAAYFDDQSYVDYLDDDWWVTTSAECTESISNANSLACSTCFECTGSSAVKSIIKLPVLSSGAGAFSVDLIIQSLPESADVETAVRDPAPPMMRRHDSKWEPKWRASKQKPHEPPAVVEPPRCSPAPSEISCVSDYHYIDRMERDRKWPGK